TLNALYYDPISEEVIDYHNGVADLKKRVVRMIGNPEQRYREDPVRMLRALRFAAKLDGTIEPATREPITRLASLIENVPASRLFDEILKLLTCGQAMECLRQLRSVGLHKGIIPLIDVIFQEHEGEQFVELALERTDARVRSGKTVSPSFLFAALLWKLVYHRWQERCKAGEPPVQALSDAADSVVDEQTADMAIQKRLQSDMREIWFMQSRFDRAAPKAIWRMLEQPRFRAAVDFLQLRAQAHEVDSVEAQWWMDLANADDPLRAEMIAERQNSKRGSAATGTGNRKRRRRSPSTRIRKADGAAPEGQ